MVHSGHSASPLLPARSELPPDKMLRSLHGATADTLHVFMSCPAVAPAGLVDGKVHASYSTLILRADTSALF